MIYPYYGWNKRPYYNYGYFPYIPNSYRPTEIRSTKDSNNLHYNSYVNTDNGLNSCKIDNETKRHNSVSEDKPIFNLGGLKIYFDDMLLLGVLFFLYSEDVNDPELFIAILLLLIS